jgi:hypothetical protein
MPIPAVPGSWQRPAGRMRYPAGNGIRIAAQAQASTSVPVHASSAARPNHQERPCESG